MPVPSIGRIVHYQSYGTPNGEYVPEPRAAIITAITPQAVLFDAPEVPHVSLCVLNPTGFFFNHVVPFAETPTPGHWNWPPTVS